MNVKSYRDLKVWQRGIGISKLTYKLVKDFPKDETYGLNSQIRRCAISIPSNIAEGHARSYTKDFLRFLSIAQGSVAELETQLILAQEFKFGDNSKIQTLMNELDEVGRMLNALKTSLSTNP